MKPGFALEVMPLGLLLQAAARKLARAKDQPIAWLAPLAEVFERAAGASAARPNRFARVEVAHLRGDEALAPAADPADTAPPQALPPDVRERLRWQVGDAARDLRVHDGEQADWLARQHRADAVSLGPDVYFARGRYQPHDSRGFSLLAHEAVHVAHAARDEVGSQRGSLSGLAAEESAAHAVERAALRGGPAASHPGFAPFSRTPGAARATAARAEAAPAASSSSSAQRPMAASSDRAVDVPPAAPAMDMESLRQTLMRDLMNQIRADMERGG